MERLTELGRALERLRVFAGFSLESCASKIDVPINDVRRAEQGEVSEPILEALARLYTVDLDGLSEGVVRRTEDDAAAATVFLLHGPYPDFDARDLDVLCQAMEAGRRLTANAGADSAALSRRLALVPTAPAGPNRVHAARQGYKLARAVRRHLGLVGEPLPSLVSLLQQLGIAVVEGPIVSGGLRAASIVDAHRAAAAAVLNASDAERQRKPSLARVFLAHELCHILFDPCRPGTVRLALDDHGTNSGWNVDALLESRAKGFAAEFLLPEAGLLALLGAKSAVAELSVARELVQKARACFGTPGEIAVNHLANLGFIRPELRFDLIGTLRSTAQSEFLEPALEAAPALDASSKVVDPAILAADARAITHAAGSRRWAAVVQAARHSVSASRPIEATDALVEHLDSLLTVGEIDAVQEALTSLEPSGFPPQVLTGVLTITFPAKAELGEARVRFVKSVMRVLSKEAKLSAERVSAIEQRLG